MALLLGMLDPPGALARAAQPWPDVLVSARVPGDWVLSAQAIGRVADGKRTSQLETRAQVGRVLGARVTAWIGWVHVASFNPGRANGREDQVVEQLNWTCGVWGRVGLATRTRLEQRFVKDVARTNWRWRQQVRLTVALGGRQAPRAVVWTEPFVALNRTARQSHTLDQLRTFAGVAFPLSRRSDLEIGYLNQRIYQADRSLVNHAIPAVLTFRY